MEVNITHNQKKTAVFMMLSATLLLSVMQVFVKLSSGNIGTYQQVFFRNSISMFVAFLLIKKRHLSLLGTRADQLILFSRSFFGYVGMVTFFYAAKYASQADVATLTRTSPVFVTLFAAMFLKEKITRIQIPVILLCMGGAYIAMQPSFDSNVVPLLSALLSAAVSGVAYTLVARCRDRVNPLTVIFYFSFFSMVAAGVMMIPAFTIPTMADLMLLLMIGLCGSFGQIGLTYALQMAPAAEISIYQYSGIVFSSILGYLILGESVAHTSILGAVMITGASIWTYLYRGGKNK